MQQAKVVSFTLVPVDARHDASTDTKVCLLQAPAVKKALVRSSGITHFPRLPALQQCHFFTTSDPGVEAHSVTSIPKGAIILDDAHISLTVGKPGEGGLQSMVDYGDSSGVGTIVIGSIYRLLDHAASHNPHMLTQLKYWLDRKFAELSNSPATLRKFVLIRGSNGDLGYAPFDQTAEHEAPYSVLVHPTNEDLYASKQQPHWLTFDTSGCGTEKRMQQSGEIEESPAHNSVTAWKARLKNLSSKSGLVWSSTPQQTAEEV